MEELQESSNNDNEIKCTGNKKHRGWGEDKKALKKNLAQIYTMKRTELTETEAHVLDKLPQDFPHLNVICVSDNINNEMAYQSFHKYYFNKKTVMVVCRNEINKEVVNKRIRPGDKVSDTLILYNGYYRVIEGNMVELYRVSLSDILKA